MADEVAPDEGAEPEQTDQDVTDSATDDDTDALGDAGKQALDRMKAERNEAKKRAKALERELEEARKASMSEAEKAIADARAEERTKAATEFGSRLVRSEFIATAARRNAGFDASQILDDLNLSKFLDDDGQPDDKAIAAAVTRLVPEVTGSPSFDGGARTSAPAQTGMNGLIRKATGRA